MFLSFISFHFVFATLSGMSIKLDEKRGSVGSRIATPSIALHSSMPSSISCEFRVPCYRPQRPCSVDVQKPMNQKPPPRNAPDMSLYMPTENAHLAIIQNCALIPHAFRPPSCPPVLRLPRRRCSCRPSSSRRCRPSSRRLRRRVLSRRISGRILQALCVSV